MVNDYEEFALCIGEINLIVCLRISNSQGVYHMPLATLISSNEAAQLKACTRQAILDAIERGAIDGQKVGRNFLARKNGKFQH